MRNFYGSFPKKWQAMPTNISKNLSPRRPERSNFNADSGARKYGHCQKKQTISVMIFFVKKKTDKQNLENNFEKLQDKARAGMGLLANLWKILEDAKSFPHQKRMIELLKIS